MRFSSTDNKRLKARNRRYKKEINFRKFRIWQKAIVLFGVVTIIWALYDDFKNVEVNEDDAFLYAILAIYMVVLILISFFVGQIGKGMAANIIIDFFDEVLYLNNGVLYREYSHAMGVGIIFGSIAGNPRVVNEIDLNKIEDLRICHETGRVEFKANTRIVVYKEREKINIQSDCIFEKHWNVFYDCYTPSLIEYFVENGYSYEEGDREYIFRHDLVHANEKRRKLV